MMIYYQRKQHITTNTLCKENFIKDKTVTFLLSTNTLPRKLKSKWLDRFVVKEISLSGVVDLEEPNSQFQG